MLARLAELPLLVVLMGLSGAIALIPALYALIKEWQLKQGVGAPPEGLP